MLLDLSRIKFRSAIRGFSMPSSDPFQLFGYEPDRLVVIIYADYTGPYLSAAHAPGDLYPTVGQFASYYGTIDVYGPEPIWVIGSNGGFLAPVNGYWQAIYRA